VGVTRQFDFGQFVVLYGEATVDGKTISLPLVVAPDGTVSDTAQKVSPPGSQLAGTNGRSAAASGAGRLLTPGTSSPTS
jgi:hypothetical protein